MLLAQLTQATSLTLPIFTVGAAISALVVAVWRVASAVKGLRDDLKRTWTFRDQERWALDLERENKKIELFVPDVKRAPSEERRDAK